MNLVRDLLDRELVDRNGRAIGRVDGIVVELRADRPPRLVAVEAGVVSVARRISPRLARWVRRAAIDWSPVPLTSVRFSPDLFRDLGVDIQLDVAADEDRRLLRLEKWLSRHVVARLPGGAR
jgi:hypothetical protein